MTRFAKVCSLRAERSLRTVLAMSLVLLFVTGGIAWESGGHHLLGWESIDMDWKLFASTFAAVFVAELGDKTQLATLSLAAGGSSRWIVFGGAALALVTTSAIAVLAGESISRLISPVWLQRAAGIIFLVLGSLFLVRAQL